MGVWIFETLAIITIAGLIFAKIVLLHMKSAARTEQQRRRDAKQTIAANRVSISEADTQPRQH